MGFSTWFIENNISFLLYNLFAAFTFSTIFSVLVGFLLLLIDFLFSDIEHQPKIFFYFIKIFMRLSLVSVLGMLCVTFVTFLAYLGGIY